MDIKAKHVALIIGVTLIAIFFDLHRYLFDRGKYLRNKAVYSCTQAELARNEYRECKTEGYKDERCGYLLATSIEGSAQCKTADAAIDAEYYRNRARNAASK